ncbi:hypothetical protein DUNSADRAFT_4 [Dunaliella salina]|uniref:Uncharacterized protein n=1 Tax=Dunaliella salina TaxID=3046 RepID=A0ABQ7HAK1_DUNSA|nr:hypothetical protein DUNSADRAFT_4 [Dunaliella salina]|eukprot:KAF5843882.1 hypothetical protein DUNSADRAFT_4 [Dunaliella salina]
MANAGYKGESRMRLSRIGQGGAAVHGPRTHDVFLDLRVLLAVLLIFGCPNALTSAIESRAESIRGDGLSVDRFSAPEQCNGRATNALLESQGSALPYEADFSGAIPRQQRDLLTLSSDGGDPECLQEYLDNLSGTSGHDYCGTEDEGGCANCVGSQCQSADKKGEDASICRFPVRVGGTVPDCKLCSTGCPGKESAKVWEVPLYVQRTDSELSETEGSDNESELSETEGSNKESKLSETVGKLVVWQESFRELHAAVKLDCPWMMWSSLAPNSWWWNREVGREHPLHESPNGSHGQRKHAGWGSIEVVEPPGMCAPAAGMPQ